MKKFFTLFALLSVGLSAWAQTYTFMLRADGWDEIYSCKITPGEPLRRLFYLNDNFAFTYEFSVWEDGNDDDYVACEDFDLEEEYSPGWYDLTFTYNPNVGWGVNPLTHQENGGTIEINYNFDRTEINLTDEVSFATKGRDYVDYKRTCNNQWGTLCLPIYFKTSGISGVTFYEFSNANSDELVFSPLNDEIVEPGTPVVFKFESVNGGELQITNDGVAKEIEREANSSDNVNGFTMHGTFESVNSGNDIYYYIANRDDEEGVYYGTNITVPPYRAWFTGPTPSGAPLRISVDDTEGLQFVEQEDGTVKVSYDLQGRKLDDARKGLMIENGKVIMVK